LGYRVSTGIDNVIGRVQSKLRELGVDGNTVIIYTADNGYYLADRGFADKWTHYEESLRVPLVVYDPRLPEKNRGRVDSSMVLNSDLGPTILDLANQPKQATHTGRSLKPLLHNQTPPDWRKDFLCEFLAVPATIPKWEGVRDERWTYARYFVENLDKAPYEFLHDLQTDPDQLVNLANTDEGNRSSSTNDALVKMRTRCDQLVAENGPTMKEILSAKPNRRSERNNE
jgi:arylsulfatase A-like enzyme